MFLLFAVVKYINILCIFFVQLSSKRETCGDKSRQLRDAQQDARDKVEVKYWKKAYCSKSNVRAKHQEYSFVCCKILISHVYNKHTH